MKLYEIAHSRTGDKGNISNISLIAYDPTDFELLRERVTASRVREFFSSLGVTEVRRYELPQLGALNFVLHNALAGGVTSATTLDKHGKTLGSFLLEMEI
ncbi:hypothetical protein [Robiginitalea sp. SC105]|uniref:AtuA-related protein n=1 Tax=Robiginitalea sp. SC105 TaxID=2762332 RepID=UPI001639F872|nr:hypothetical protein [Robiginitalea sp. SC105]MBC2839210.1 hypothetical protein [Robiginitalea sp. SC105]